MKGIVLIFIFLSYSAFSQVVYQSHEVETPAKPSGGEDVFSLFITSNLRIPITSSWKGLSGRVFVKATIEINGSSSNLEIIRGIDTLCNAEAIRVASLYTAWQPARLNGNAVRQTVTIPIVFKSASVVAYDSTSQSLITYFDRKWVITSVKEQYKYRRFIPVDDFGFVNGDVLYEKKEDETWSPLGSIKLTKKEFWKKMNEENKADSLLAFSISANYEQGNQPIYQSVERDEKGIIIEFIEFSETNEKILGKSYFRNGLLKEMIVYGKDINQHTYWYENGQLSGIFEKREVYFKTNTGTVKEYYDRNGNHLVKNGNGYFAVQKGSITGFDGNGEVKNGVKEGIWTAKTEDSTLVYREQYHEGVLTTGTSFYNGEKFEYTETEVQPEFSGGMPLMYKYLSQNIKYPRDAARKNITGHVFTTFVVCEDGTLCDFTVLKGLDESIDQEAIRVIKGMSGKWQPGLQRGRKVKVKYNLPINFQLR